MKCRIKSLLSNIFAMAPEMRRPSRRTIDWMRPQEAQAPLKIERKCDGKTTIIWLIGRIRSEDLDELKAQMDDNSERTILDLDEVTLVDAAVIRFLSSSLSALRYWAPKKTDTESICRQLSGDPPSCQQDDALV